MERIFKSLIVLSVTLYVIFYFIPYFHHFWLNEPEIHFWKNNGAQATLILPDFIFHLLMIAWVLTSIGIFYYNKIARSCFLLLIIATTLMTPFLGWSIYTSIESTIIVSLNMIDGALIVMAYLTSISHEFENA